MHILRWQGNIVASALLSLGLLAGPALASVTEKVEGMIAENTPLKVRDNDLWAMVGGPLAFGIQYDKYANANVAIGIGAGSYIAGTSLDLGVKLYLLPGRFSPFLTLGGVFYYSRPTQNVFALFGTVGLSYFFADGFGLSAGFNYSRAVAQSQEPFSYYWINDSLNWPSPQIGIHWNY